MISPFLGNVIFYNHCICYFASYKIFILYQYCGDVILSASDIAADNSIAVNLNIDDLSTNKVDCSTLLNDYLGYFYVDVDASGNVVLNI